MWIPLKTLQSIALWLVLNTTTATTRDLSLALGIFGLHLALGNYWNVVFMGRKQIKQSLPVMAAFWFSIVAGIAAFWRVDPLAGKLFLPTIGWVTVAAKLNWDIAALRLMIRRRRGENNVLGNCDSQIDVVALCGRMCSRNSKLKPLLHPKERPTCRRLGLL